MANGNPFAIDVSTPAVQQGLQGLGQVFGQIGQQRREDEVKAASQKRFESAQRDIMAAYQSGDPNKMAEVSIKYPEFQKVTEQAFGYANEQTKATSRSVYSQLLSNPDNAEQILINGIAQVEEQGGNPAYLRRGLEAVRQNPEAGAQAAIFEGSALFPDVHKAYTNQQKAQADLAGKPASVQSSDILPDGTTIQVLKDGSTRVTGPEGRTLKGKDAAAAVKAARKFGTEVSVEGARGRAQAGVDPSAEKDARKAAISVGKETFKSIKPIRKSISNIDKAISAIDQGANTGVIASRLPSITAASIELDNLRGQLGLDVVGETTFGALSEGELQLALDVALPETLDEAELKDFLIRKRDAQKKVLKEMESAARFLSSGKGTISAYIEKLEAEKPAPQVNRIRFDAQGNII